jgi:type VI secretion system protein ImpG
VLSSFFARHASINSFTETVLRVEGRGEVMRWPMQAGRRAAA